MIRVTREDRIKNEYAKGVYKFHLVLKEIMNENR